MPADPEGFTGDLESRLASDRGFTVMLKLGSFTAEVGAGGGGSSGSWEGGAGGRFLGGDDCGGGGNVSQDRDGPVLGLANGSISSVSICIL